MTQSDYESPIEIESDGLTEWQRNYKRYNYHRFYSTSEIIQYAEKMGSHFFKPDTMKFWGSRVLSGVWQDKDGSHLFITSERNYDRTARHYTIRRIDANGDVTTVSDFQKFNRADSARRAIERMLAK